MGSKPGRPRTKTTWRAKTESDLDTSTRILLAQWKAAYDEAEQKKTEATSARQRMLDLLYACRAAGVPQTLLGAKIGRNRRVVYRWMHDLKAPNEYLTDQD